jgi:hypothetical protein
MLAFAHIPTGTATNNEFDIDEVNSRHLKLAVAPTIGADIAMTYGKIPYASEQGIFSGRNRELNLIGKPPLPKLSSHQTLRWREMDSNFRFRAR